MYHRYGRHGPHAWYRWHKRRFNQYLPATVPQIAVVRVHIPIVVERVIFIVEGSNNQGTGPISVEGNLLRSGTTPDPFHYPRLMATVEARNQAEDDFAGEAGVPPESIIREKARQSWRKNASTQKILDATNEQTDINDVRNVYLNTYMTEYQEAMREEQASIPDETTYAVERVAHADKERDGDVIPPEYLSYQAAFQVRPYITLHPSDKLAFLEELDKQVKTYIRAYQQHSLHGRDDRSSRSEPFQNGGLTAFVVG